MLCAADGCNMVSSMACPSLNTPSSPLSLWCVLQAARVAWADYFDSKGISYLFWSAKLAAQVADDEAGAR